MKSFYFVARWQLNVPGVEQSAGGIIMPAGIASHTLTRRQLGKSALQHRLFDPQVYLGDLPPMRCRKACGNLSSYDWFKAVGAKPYDSSKEKQKDYNAQVRATIGDTWRQLPTDETGIQQIVDQCIEFQRHIGCETLILPSPLTRLQASDYSREILWLEIGLARARKLAPGMRALATIAISDTCLKGFATDDNDLLEVILDQVTARATDGAYLVLEQANESTYYCSSSTTIQSMLRLVRGLKDGGLKQVIVAYAGVAGILALLVGADGWATGWYRGERRCKLNDFEDNEGRARATYYSHPLASEIQVTDDLVRIYRAGFFDELEDQTAASADLIARLRAEGKVPLNWVGAKITAARSHFAHAMIRETAAIASLGEKEQHAYGRAWLDKAQATAAKLTQLGGLNDRTEIDHQRAWRDAFKAEVSG